MFTLKFLRNSLINSVNSNRNSLVVNSRSLQLFKKPSDAAKDVEEEEEESAKIAFEDDDQIDPELRQMKIDRMRDKSRLRAQHRNFLHDQVPYNQAESWIHNTLKYKRMMYGRYGSESQVDPRLCFYTKTELAEKNEYERVAFPKTIQEMIAYNEEEKRKQAERIRTREENIALNLQKLETWKKDLLAKKEKKEGEARIAKERKDRLIEEVRRHFGYTVHPKDERFKEMLEKKEKEQRKQLKEAKKQQKEAKLLTKIAEQNKPGKDEKPEKDDD
ncbi:large ribosomal subunit protein mL64 [Chironomus tepperi]|uniref:large ribosomal subunit protein mL64 n=1 Tax=Chironomus tepperi TaxID=113505 RepID=UPI00391F3F7E